LFIQPGTKGIRRLVGKEQEVSVAMRVAFAQSGTTATQLPLLLLSNSNHPFLIISKMRTQISDFQNLSQPEQLRIAFKRAWQARAPCAFH